MDTRRFVVNSKTYNPDCDFDPDQIDLDRHEDPNKPRGCPSCTAAGIWHCAHVDRCGNFNLVPENRGISMIGNDLLKWAKEMHERHDDLWCNGDGTRSDVFGRNLSDCPVCKMLKAYEESFAEAVRLVREGMEATGTSSLTYHKMREAIELLTVPNGK